MPWPCSSGLGAEPHPRVEWLGLQHAVIDRLLVAHDGCLTIDIDVLGSLLLVLKIDDLPWGKVHIMKITSSHVGWRIWLLG